MSGTNSDADRADELTERYRVASAADPSRPSDSVRDSVFAHARTVVADQAPRGISIARLRRPAANDSYWRLSAAASVIVAVFATLLAWHLHTPVPVRNPTTSDVAASNQAAAEGSVASSRPSEPLPNDRGANVAPAPNAVTARSGARVDAAAEARRPEHDAGTHQSMAGASVASARQAPARIAAGSAAENATSDTQVAPSPAAAPPNVQARRAQAQEAAASARSGIAASSPLISAAESGNLVRVDQLLHSGVSTEQSDARGRTALFVATLRGDVAMVRRLLAAGARADVVDEAGDTPLAAARRQGPPELVSVLEQATHP
jgi:hypothetical protein